MPKIKRDTDFHARCRALADSPRFFSWAKSVLEGENVEPKMTPNGLVMTPASTGDRTYLWERLTAYGFGRPPQDVNLTGELAGRIVLVRADKVKPRKSEDNA